MAFVTLPKSLTDGTTAYGSDVLANDQAIANDYNGNITNVNLAAGAAIVDTKLAQITTANKVSGTSLTGLASIPVGAGVIPAANIPTVAGAPYYRSGMYVMQSSTVTMTIAPGVIDVGGTTVTKTANTTMTLTSGANWAGGVSLQATGATGYVGIDINGNVKMHTTAPSHADYALTITAANNTKRYVSWSSVTYRVIGWFRMNGTGSGELDAYGVSNLADGMVKNVVYYSTGAYTDATGNIACDDSIPLITEGTEVMIASIVPTNLNNRLKVTVVVQGAASAAAYVAATLFQDASAGLATAFTYYQSTNIGSMPSIGYIGKAGLTSYTTFRIRVGASAGSFRFNGNDQGSAGRKYGGISNSFIMIEELESQYT